MKTCKKSEETSLDLFKKEFDNFFPTSWRNSFLDFGFHQMDEEFKKLQESIDELKKNIKKTKNGITVTVPYDRNKETLKQCIENGVLTVIVKSEDGTHVSSTSVTLPENFEEDLKGVYRQYDKEKHEMHLHFSLKK